MKVCDNCESKEVTSDDDDVIRLRDALKKEGDYCNDCLKKLNNWLNGKAVIITKEEHREYKKLQAIDKAAKELSKEKEVKPQ